MRAAALVAICALGAVARAAPQKVSLAYPSGAVTTGFAVCGPGFALVPVDGGVAAAGLDGWVVPPGVLAVTGVACDRKARLFVVLGGERLVAFHGVSEGTVELLATLPGDRFQLAGNSGDDGVYLYGRDRRGTSWIFQFQPKRGLRPLWRGGLPVRTASVAAPNALLAVIGGDLVLFRGTAATGLLHLPDPIDGVASDARGDVYLSTAGRILHLRAHAPARVLAAGIHGPLRVHGGALYVEWREQHRLVRISMEHR